MSDPSFGQKRFQQGFLLLLAIGISSIFLSMVSQFIITLFLAAIFSGILHPVYRRLVKWFNGRKNTASFVTLLLTFIVVIGPMIGLASIVASEAYDVTQAVRPWIEQRIQSRNQLDTWLAQFPIFEELRPYQAQITEKLAEFAGSIGNFLLNGLGAATAGTATFFFQFFIMLYAMFFLLIDGEKALRKILYYMPLSHADESLMLEKFVSVTLATVKGTILIGAIQGVLFGAAFAFFGIPSATFWGTVMAVLSILPAVGAALVWVPAVIYLFATGENVSATILAGWCGLLVGLIDNFLRPRMVGYETKMSDLMILVSTLGGLALFGIVGFIIGPLIAALFLTIWEIYGVAFKDLLPESFPLQEKGPELAEEENLLADDDADVVDTSIPGKKKGAALSATPDADTEENVPGQPGASEHTGDRNESNTPDTRPQGMDLALKTSTAQDIYYHVRPGSASTEDDERGEHPDDTPENKQDPTGE